MRGPVPVSLTPLRVILSVRALHPPSERVRTPGGNPRGCPASAFLGARAAGRGPAGLGDTGDVLPTGPDRLVCSARGCRADADWALHWNNPRLHTPERRKTWLACDGHREDLERFLALRGFLRESAPVATLPEGGR